VVMVLRESCREIMEIKESLRFVLNVWQFNNPPYFSITAIKLLIVVRMSTFT
jgi:hypothetical protein